MVVEPQLLTSAFKMGTGIVIRGEKGRDSGSHILFINFHIE